MSLEKQDINDSTSTVTHYFFFFCLAEALQSKLEQKYKTEVDALKQAHSNEIRVAKMELDRAVEISKQKVCALLI